MGMSGEHHIGLNSGRLGDLINIVEDVWTRRVVLAASERRMVDGDNQRAAVAAVSLLLCCLQLLLQEIQLSNSNDFAADHALRAAFTGIRVQPNDLYERRIEREVDARLRHRSSRVALRFDVL